VEKKTLWPVCQFCSAPYNIPELSLKRVTDNPGILEILAIRYAQVWDNNHEVMENSTILRLMIFMKSIACNFFVKPFVYCFAKTVSFRFVN